MRSTAYKILNLSTVGSDKSLLRVDAKRLFLHEGSNTSKWDASYDVKYKSGKQAYRHGERDGTAFASIALPSHYAAIVAVLDHVKQRLGPNWVARHIIDWGSGTGSGLWSVESDMKCGLLNHIPV